MTRSLLPSDLPANDPLKQWRRAAVISAVAHVRGVHLDQAARHLWGDERGAAIFKAATAPASTTGWGSQAVGTAVGAFLDSLRPRSSAAQLFAASARFGLSGSGAILLPRPGAGFTEPVFVAEGAPIPAQGAGLSGDTLGPPRKLAMLAGLTNELRNYSAFDAEAIIRELMDDAAARALDGALFSNAAASSTRPAGLLNGVTAIPSNGGSDFEGMVKDVQALIGAIADAGGGRNVWLFADPRQATSILLRSPNATAFTIVPTPSLASGTVVAVDVGAIASGFTGLPEIEVAKDATVHWEDTAPLAISTPGAPNTVAAPVRSGFQTDSFSLRQILRCAWVNRLPGAVQYVTGAIW